MINTLHTTLHTTLQTNSLNSTLQINTHPQLYKLQNVSEHVSLSSQALEHKQAKYHDEVDHHLDKS